MLIADGCPTPEIPVSVPPPNSHPPFVVVGIIIVFLTVLAFSLGVLHAGVEVVAAGTFVALVVPAACKAAVRLFGPAAA